jgi:hypothetical protein
MGAFVFRRQVCRVASLIISDAEPVNIAHSGTFGWDDQTRIRQGVIYAAAPSPVRVDPSASGKFIDILDILGYVHFSSQSLGHRIVPEGCGGELRTADAPAKLGPFLAIICIPSISFFCSCATALIECRGVSLSRFSEEDPTRAIAQ